MKKLLTIISAVTLTATGALTLVSCNNEKEVEQKEVSYEALMSSRVDTFFNGSLNIISTEGETTVEDPMPQDAVMWELLSLSWTGENKWIEGFLEKPTQSIQLDEDITYVFEKFEIKNEFKNQKQIILDSVIDEEYLGITHGDDKYIFPKFDDQISRY